MLFMCVRCERQQRYPCAQDVKRRRGDAQQNVQDKMAQKKIHLQRCAHRNGSKRTETQSSVVQAQMLREANARRQ